MKSVKSGLWLAPLLLLVALVIDAPARAVLWLLPDHLVLQADNFQGTLWRGSANQVVMGSNGAYVAVDTVRWQLRPLSLLLFSPQVDINIQAPGQDAAASLQWQGEQSWRAEDLELNMPAAVAGHFIAGNQPLAGQLSLRLSQLQMAGGRIEAIAGNVSWQPARWHNGNRWMDFGSLAGELSQRGEDIQLTLFDLSGPLEIDGQLVVKPSGQLLVKGTVGLRPQAPQEFSQALPLFAERQPDGKYKVDFQY